MRKLLLAAGVCALAIGLATTPARAQDEDPPMRYVAVTSFDVPFADRALFMEFMEEYFLPGYQLDPNVRNFRMMNHLWGSNASEVVLIAEFDTWEALNAECAPCEAYFAQHEAPEEGDAGYADYQAKLAVFNKYYANHADEIYSTNMDRAVVDGRALGRVGPAPEGAASN